MRECPYCLSPILESDASVQCPACGARHHDECWSENGGCAAKGCSELSASRIEISVEEEPRTMLVLTKEVVEQARPDSDARRSNPCIGCGKQLPDGELYCPKCEPALGENQDGKNAGPILVMIGIVALLVTWLIISMVGIHPLSSVTGDQPHSIGARR